MGVRGGIQEHVNRLDEVLTSVRIELSSTTEIAKSAHKRLDDVDEEVELSRKVKNHHAELIVRHDGILQSHEGLFVSIKDGIKEGFAELATAMKERTKDSASQDKRILRIELMVGAIITLGTIVASAAFWVVAHVGSLLHWW